MIVNIGSNDCFKQQVEFRADSLLSLMKLALESFSKFKEELHQQEESQKEVYKEYDFESDKTLCLTWYPDFSDEYSFLEEMEMNFKKAMIQRIYTFAECGLKVISELTRKPKNKGGGSQSDIQLYFQEIVGKYEIQDIQLEKLWPTYENFHLLRKNITHKDTSLINIDVGCLENNIKHIKDMLIELHLKSFKQRYVEN